MGLVILYHLFPQRVTGGFIGVDIFFVISGFLIVGSLVHGASRTGTVPLLSFYARRIRRLLPASTAVLLATMLAAIVILPQSRWQDVARDVVASALQVQNWNLAFSAGSYEAAGSLVSPVQHFWSLAVEEQFYLFIPLLLIVAVACGRIMGKSAIAASLVVLILVSAVSLGYSAIFSVQSHDIAYFATTTRIWELGVGGIAALVLPRIGVPGVLRIAGGWLGFAAVVTSALVFQTAMAFPGYVAVLPVLGTVLIIGSGMGPTAGATTPGARRWGVAACLGLRPVTYLGDISYSLYLWHWPVIVFYLEVRGRTPGPLGSAGIVVLSLLLASLSYHQIEQRFRFGKPVRPAGGRRYRPVVRNRAAYGLAAVLVTMSVMGAAVPWTVVQAKTESLAEATLRPAYPGAMAYDPKAPAPVPAGMPIIPDPAVAAKDIPLTARTGCARYDSRKLDDTKCVYGTPDASKTVVLVGDSHAGQYSDALAAIGERHGWTLRTMVRNGCPFATVPPITVHGALTDCSTQNARSLDKILAMKPQLVVMSAMMPYGYRQALAWNWKSQPDLVDGYVHNLDALHRAGIKVSIIRDLPYPGLSLPDCVASHGASAKLCQVDESGPNSTPDPLVQAAERVPGTKVVDLRAYFCRNKSCAPVVGNVLVYRDNHMTATFVKTLEIPLQKALGL
ncbi:acyltransferase family protein [Arthrobacter dokdonensis]|uniref:acyltransferase family protein n=1 Tax=Arthrobacter dokdonellae TaxID=2211210 RepID=UPI001F2A8F62|nr:acyltransferase family protein [Arthrobacter dokdonellae]